jgi:hypothetical protein
MSDIVARLAVLKGKIEKFDLMPWTVEGWSTGSNARIATAPDLDGHRHTVCKFPKTSKKGRAAVIVDAINVIPEALDEIERLGTALASTNLCAGDK